MVLVLKKKWVIELQDFGVETEIKGQKISIVKWKPELYGGDFEIYSWNKLFDGVKRFSNFGKMISFLNEIENENFDEVEINFLDGKLEKKEIN